ncbi:MAG: imidazolonepropionase [Candidatus Melainabacteria bacterium]|nr:imidazolonepropionase [Candidatus Melainabacteria bacterium]
MGNKQHLDILIEHASELLTCKAKAPKKKNELANLGIIRDGAIGIKSGKIVFVGTNLAAKKYRKNAKKIIDAKNKVVMPGFVDSHTHAIFAGTRENEFLKKLQGIPYLQILKQGGGILSTVAKTRKASKKELFQGAERRFKTMLKYGTTTVEVKSGYGLTFEDEKKILEVARMLDKKLPLDIVTTYLGAHTIPSGHTNGRYVDEVITSLKKIKPYAEFCDVFCEKGIFTVSETRKIFETAKSLGYKLKLHCEQLSTQHSAELAANLKAISADHLEHISKKGLKALAKHGVIGVLLPGVNFYLMQKKYAPARDLIKSGIPIAIASDFNPGSCPTFNMQLIISLACLKLKMQPSEAINAATINAAYAIDRGGEIGSLEVGKKADVILLDIDNHNKLPYFFGVNLVEKVIKAGKVV